MKKTKKPTLADLEKRMSEWFSSYVAEHELLPLGKRAVLVLEVAHYQTTHLYSSSLKIAKADPAVSWDEPMTENDWGIIHRLPVFRKAPEHTVQRTLADALKQMHTSGEAIALPYHHVQQINTVFDGNGLMYRVFKVSGSTSSPWRGASKYKVYKRL